MDAKALRESALKNAEAVIVDKYSDEVKNVLEQLLRARRRGARRAPGDLGLEAPALEDAPGNAEPVEPWPNKKDVTEDEVPLAATDGLANNDGQNLSALPNDGEEVEVNIDLGALQEAIANLSAEVD